MTTAIKTRLDKLVANKVIDAAQEKTLLSRLSARVAKEVDQKGLPLKPPAFRFPQRVPNGPNGAPKGPNVPLPPAYTPTPGPSPVA